MRNFYNEKKEKQRRKFDFKSLSIKTAERRVKKPVEFLTATTATPVSLSAEISMITKKKTDDAVQSSGQPTSGQNESALD